MISISIDNQWIEADQLELHYQTDPFPGGSFYKLVSTDSSLIASVRHRLKDGEHRDLDSRNCSYVFDFIRFSIRANVGRSRPRYWLNNIHYLELSNDILVVSGTCSPHVDHEDKRVRLVPDS